MCSQKIIHTEHFNLLYYTGFLCSITQKCRANVLVALDEMAIQHGTVIDPGM